MKKAFHLEEQQLFDAVKAWRDQSGLEVMWQTEPPRLRRTPEVTGTLSPDEALTQLLAGTGLTYSMQGQTAIISLEAETASQNHKTKRRDLLRRSQSKEGAMNTKPSNALVAEVLVTGTHIRGGPPIGSPVIILSEEEIRRSGYTTTEEIVRALVQNIRSGIGGESADFRLSAAPGASGNVIFGTAATLRGLGSAATLTLVNGHRVAPSGQGFVDLSQIPVAAISRIEILTDGASAVYGADAIAGVVNIILKDDVDAPETRVRYGFTKPDGRTEVSASHTLGARWEDGGFVAVASYVDQGRLGVDERSSTRNVVQPETILPGNEQLGLHVAAHRRFENSVTIQADTQQGRTRRFALGSAPSGHLEFPIQIDRRSASMSVHYGGIQGWDFALKGDLSQEEVDFSYSYFPPGSFFRDISRSEVQRLNQDQWIAGASATGTLASLGAGSVELAVGAEHREEAYTHALRSPTVRREHVARTVDSAYVELQVPLTGEDNGNADAKGLSLSLAGRYDAYSDVGDIFNPKFGVSWKPVAGLELRSTYSQSFRSPTVGAELLSTSRGTDALVSVYSFTTADGRATIPVAFVTGSRDLRPERARHRTASITLEPAGMEGWQFATTYYSIAYTGRIVRPPLDTNALSNRDLQGFIKQYSTPTQLQAAIGNETGGHFMYVDRTGAGFEGGAFGPNPQNLATYVFDARLTNASVVNTSGVDLGVSYSGKVRGGQLDLALNANYIHELETIFGPGARAVDSVGMVGNPAGLKLRGDAAYTRGGWSAALAVNFTDEYTDTGTGFESRVSPYFTVDAQLSYTFHSQGVRMLDDLSIRLLAENILNEGPPHIVGLPATRGSNYDTANADSRGQLFAIELSKRW